MNQLFYYDSILGREITYNQLIDDIRSTTVFHKYCKTLDYYSIFKHILISLLLGREVILLDGDFSKQEMNKLIQDDYLNDEGEDIESILFEDLILSNLLVRIKNNSQNWKIQVFTSGTTGVPKSIVHTYDSLTRQVRKSDKHIDDVWGFAYNPTHMAGLQVFFQALLNLNTMVRLFQVSKDRIFDLLDCFKITNISATPTFYRLLFPCDKIFCNVKRITSGGEKFDVNVRNRLQFIFPNAKIINVYASTEAGTLFASAGDCFEIKSEIRHLFKIEKNELLIHQSLLGSFKNIQINDEWYHSGDLIEIVENFPLLKFRFVSRINEMINVGGYKVNPNEVEEVLRSIVGIQDAKIYAKSNSLIGNVLCAQVVLNDKSMSELDIRRNLQMRLQEFKIPRVIKCVESIETTRTGKIKR